MLWVWPRYYARPIVELWVNDYLVPKLTHLAGAGHSPSLFTDHDSQLCPIQRGTLTCKPRNSAVIESILKHSHMPQCLSGIEKR